MGNVTWTIKRTGDIFSPSNVDDIVLLPGEGNSVQSITSHCFCGFVCILAQWNIMVSVKEFIVGLKKFLNWVTCWAFTVVKNGC